MPSIALSFSLAFFSSRRACQLISPAMADFSIATACSCSLSAATTASTAPSFSALSGRFSAPMQIHSIALSAPITRGRRTVPPKPGIRPSLTSGRPTLALSDMIRRSEARHISKPPPRAMPLIAVRVGTSRSSNALKIWLASRVQAAISSSLRLNVSPNSVMSAPTINTSLPEVTRTPLTSLLPWIALTAASRSSIVTRLNLLTDSPCRSNFSSAIPPSIRVTVMALPS